MLAPGVAMGPATVDVATARNDHSLGKQSCEPLAEPCGSCLRYSGNCTFHHGLAVPNQTQTKSFVAALAMSGRNKQGSNLRAHQSVQ